MDICGYTTQTGVCLPTYLYVDICMVVSNLLLGATGFDRVVLRWAAGRGLLATLNRGTVKLN